VRLAFIALALGAVNSCAIADEISDLYFQQQKQKIADRRASERAAKRRSRPKKAAPPKKNEPGDDPIASTGHGITEIGSERTVGFHSGPVYALIVKSDGTFRFEGRHNVDHVGKWTGTVDRNDFDEVAKLIRDAGYMGFQDTYPNHASDITPLYTMVVLDGKRYVVQDWFTGPEKLREIERRIYALLDGAKWDEQLAEPDAKPD
jgi:hypothetical protein